MTLHLKDIDALGFEEACDWLDKNGISYDLLETHGEVLDLIKTTLESDSPKMQSSEEMMSGFLTEDNIIKSELSSIYDDLKTFVKEDLGAELRQLLNTIYTNIDCRLDRNKEDLIDSDCAIVVTGETSAGKSSFLNLLIRADVLPHSLLANTSAICQIHNSDQKRFEVVTENEQRHMFTIDGDGPEAERDFVKKLFPYIGRSNIDFGDEIKHVNIFWPIPMLQRHVTIVDTPGVGESPEMTEKLVKYLPNAVAFIYIINSANAGGIQEDTILHIISELKKLDRDLELSSFDQASMIFICNKWDIVEKRGQADATWLDTVHKLKMTIPGLDEDHIFRLSVTEATRYRRSGLGNTAMYQRLLEGLEHFIPDSLIAKVRRHFRWIVRLLSKLRMSVASRINNARKSSDEKQTLCDNVSARLSKLERDSKTKWFSLLTRDNFTLLVEGVSIEPDSLYDKVRSLKPQIRYRLTKAANKEFRFITNELHDYLSREKIKSDLLTWTEDEAPDIVEDDLDVTKQQAQSMIRKRLLNVIQAWDNKTHIIDNATQTMTRLFNKECFFLEQECNDVDEVIEGISLSPGISFQSGGKSQTKTDTEQEVSAQTKTYDRELEYSEIAALVVTAPLWLPISIVITTAVATVVIGEDIKTAFERTRYSFDKAKYMREWTLMLLDRSQGVDDVSSLIEKMYLKGMLDRIDYLCSKFIPKQIATDRARLHHIVKDKRSAHDIILQFQTKKEKLKELFETMCLFDLRFLANDVIGVSKIRRYEHIGSGGFSDVYRATWRHVSGAEQEVALKILKGHDMYLQLSEVACSRKLKHQNIVEFYGVVFPDRERNRGGNGEPRSQDVGLPWYDDRLMLVLDLCEQSLESFVFRTTELQCGSFSHDLRRGETHTFFFKMAVSICEGLTYMHRLKFLHRDLKLSNILVKDGVAKLSDLGFARAEVAITGTAVGTLTHMSPELFSDKLYSFSSDVYSLGILLWELWYGKRSYSDTQIGHLGHFIDAVTRGARPNCELKHTMFPDLKKLVEKCWKSNPNDRPTVAEVAIELKQIDGKNRRVVSR